MIKGKTEPVLWKNVRINGGFWGYHQRVNRDVTIPSLYDMYKISGRFDLLKQKWSPAQGQKPHHFWDSDHAKLIEAAAYSLAADENPELEKQMDEIIELFEKVQCSDGYLNSYFTLFCPDKRFTDLMMMHELYCAGHLAEAAVAYYQATGKRRLLDVVCRYVDYIDSRIGAEEGKIHGYDGHPEIELALIRLYKVTGNEKHLKLARYLVEERGKQPYFFEEEAKKQGIDLNENVEKVYDIGSFLVDQEIEGKTELDPMVIPKRGQERVYKYYLPSKGPFAQFSANAPVRELKEPTGHAVRAMYLYCAMADLAADDPSLQRACKRLWDVLVSTQLYITGGIGQSQECERFSFAYDLPNETNYNETCASIGLLRWAYRMFQWDLDGKYIDMIERTLYNGILSGVSYQGDKFFYANYMEVYPAYFNEGSAVLQKDDRLSPVRKKLFNCSCCPANVARTVAMLGGYLYSVDEEGIYVHLYENSTASIEVKEETVELTQVTNYPWDEMVGIDVKCQENSRFALNLRIPGWCKEWAVSINGQKCEYTYDHGYAALKRQWKNGDHIELHLAMDVQVIRTNPKVRQNVGKAALQRGPIVYCIEEADNFKNLHDFCLDTSSPINVEQSSLFGGISVLKLKGTVADMDEWDGSLYTSKVPSKRKEAEVTAIPYHLWGNRGFGEMRVWIQAQP